MGRDPIALPARSVRYAVCEAMGAAVPEGFRPQPPARPTSAAGADVAEGVAVDGVAADPAVFDTDAAPSYRDRVEHPTSVFARMALDPSRLLARRAKYAERVRRARLSRWQETRG